MVIALKTLVPEEMRNVEVRVTTDNIATMHVLNTGKTRDPFMAACARELWLIAALQELRIILDHAPGETLVLADALSRRHTSHEFEKTVNDYVYSMNLIPVMPIDIVKAINDSL